MNEGALRSGSVAADSSFSDSSMRPSPIATRPRFLVLSDWAERKAMTPMAIISGDSQPRSNDRTCDVNVVPTLAPSITAIAIGRVISPRPAKEASICKRNKGTKRKETLPKLLMCLGG